MEIKPTKLLKGQGLAKWLTKENCEAMGVSLEASISDQPAEELIPARDIMDTLSKFIQSSCTKILSNTYKIYNDQTTWIGHKQGRLNWRISDTGSWTIISIGKIQGESSSPALQRNKWARSSMNFTEGYVGVTKHGEPWHTKFGGHNIIGLPYSRKLTLESRHVPNVKSLLENKS